MRLLNAGRSLFLPLSQIATNQNIYDISTRENLCVFMRGILVLYKIPNELLYMV